MVESSPTKLAVTNPKIEPLGLQHDRAAFSCLDESLTSYIRGEKGWRDSKTATKIHICANQEAPSTILGYFTLTQGSVSRDTIARALYGNGWDKKHHSRQNVYASFPYDPIGATILGRFAIHDDLRKSGFAQDLLGKAILMALEGAKYVAAQVLYLDAIHEKVVPFYEEAGFIRFEPDSLKMFIRIDTLIDGLNDK